MKNKVPVLFLSLKCGIAQIGNSVVTIVSIILTTILVMSIATVFTGIEYAIRQNSFKQTGTDAHAVIKHISYEQFGKLKNNTVSSETGYTLFVCDRVENSELESRLTQMLCMDEMSVRHQFLEPAVGSLPTEEYDILVDAKTLDLLGASRELGTRVDISFVIRDRLVTESFLVCGIIDNPLLIDVGFIIVSESYIAARENDYIYTFNHDGSLAGVVNAYFMFKSDKHIHDSIVEVIDTTTDLTFYNNSLEYSVNWAYDATAGRGTGQIIVLLALYLLVVISGYLFINNIFQISIINEVKFIGILKTIGTSPNQISRYIYYKAIALFIISVPIGILLGTGIGKWLLPIILTNSEISMPYKFEVPLSSIILAILLPFFTLVGSIQKPIRATRRISPLGAVRFTTNDYEYNHVIENNTNLSGLLSKSFLLRSSNSNYHRTPRKLRRRIIASIALGMVLHCVFLTLSNGFDLNRYVSNMIKYDYVVIDQGYKATINANIANPPLLGIDSYTVQNIESNPNFSLGGGISYYTGTSLASCEKIGTKDIYGNQIESIGELYYAALYGIDDSLLAGLNWIDGDEYSGYSGGKYIWVGVRTDDFGMIIPECDFYNCGDLITLEVNGKSLSYTVLGKFALNISTDTVGFVLSNSILLYLPTTEYRTFTGDMKYATYSFNFSGSETSDEEMYVRNLISQDRNGNLAISSRESYKKSFTELADTFNIIGYTLSIVLLLIGVLNYGNCIITSIINRKHELSIMRIVGATSTQIGQHLFAESIVYALLSCVIAITLSAVLSLTVIRALEKVLWFYRYCFTLLPIILSFTPILILCSVIPMCVYISQRKKGEVGQLFG